MAWLTDDSIRAAVRENARIGGVRSGRTVPDVHAVANYHRVRTILIALAMDGAEHALAQPRDQPGAVTEDEIAAVERQRDEILRADPQLALMLSTIEARRHPNVNAALKPKRDVRGVRSARARPDRQPEVDSTTSTSQPAGTARPAIGYTTPKGKPHAFRVKRMPQVWSRVERFLRGCTDADPLRPATASLMVSESVRSPEEPGLAFLERVREVLGPSRPVAWSGLGVVLPDSVAPPLAPLFTGGVQHQWDLSADQVDEALRLMLAGDPWPHALVPIASLTMLHRFNWTGTGRATGSPDSMCITHLASRSFLTPFFFFPFESADDSFLAYLYHIRALLPIPLSPKNFRLFQPTGRTGTLVPRLFDTSAIGDVLERSGAHGDDLRRSD